MPIQTAAERPWTAYDYDGVRPFLSGSFKGMTEAEERRLAADLARRYAQGESLAALATALQTQRQVVSILLKRHGHHVRERQGGRPRKADATLAERTLQRRLRRQQRAEEAAVRAATPPPAAPSAPVVSTPSRWDI